MRFFLEVSYKGTNYSGFQLQKNANTIQAEIEKALQVLLKNEISLTGSSRTDAGVHALQNFFHFDTGEELNLLAVPEKRKKILYNLNAILPHDISVKNIFPVNQNFHCRFNALSREYKYYTYRQKNPFLDDRAYYFPYKLNLNLLQQAASIVKEYSNFTSFSKRRTQVKTSECFVYESEWLQEDECLVYRVKANRFLRGMVRALTATMLKVGRGKLTLDKFRSVIETEDCTLASFAVPAHGLWLISVKYPDQVTGQ